LGQCDLFCEDHAGLNFPCLFIDFGTVKHFELPQLYAMNFVLERALGGGVTRSLSLDPHGKSYSELILTIPVSVPEDLSLKLLKAGRKPLREDT
jgi:hypothetical protein